MGSPISQLPDFAKTSIRWSLNGNGAPEALYPVSKLWTILKRLGRSRAELIAALDDPNPDNPLATAIAAVIASHANELNQQASRAGAIPKPVILPMPQTEIEAFALEFFSEEIRGMGMHITLKTGSPRTRAHGLKAKATSTES